MSPKSLRTATLVFIYFLTAIVAARSALFDRGRPIDVLIGFVVALTMAIFCVADSRVIGQPLIRSYHWVIFLLWPFAVPVYLLWSRGVSGAHRTGLLMLSVIAWYFAVAWGVWLVAQRLLSS